MAHLTLNPCVDCGERDLLVLEFDHVGMKRGDVAALVAEGLSTAGLRREIAACDVVCANCHRRRTASRAGWRRAAPDWRMAPSKRLAAERRNIDLAYRALERSGCVDCGLCDLTVLDFDHVSTKRANVIELARSGCGRNRLLQEIAACEVRCANCHRRRTFNYTGHYKIGRP